MATAEFLRVVLPRVNLLLVAVLIALFAILLSRRPDKQTYTRPWKVMFAALLIFVIEEVLTVLRLAGIVNYRYLTVNGFLEMGIVTLIIYMFLLQKEYLIKKRFIK